MKIFRDGFYLLQAWIFLYIRRWVKPASSVSAGILFDMTLPRSQLMLENAMLRKQLIILNEHQLCRVTREYVNYYNDHRSHQGIEQYRPNRTAPPDKGEAVVEFKVKPIIDGLHHVYERNNPLEGADGQSIVCRFQMAHVVESNFVLTF